MYTALTFMQYDYVTTTKTVLIKISHNTNLLCNLLYYIILYYVMPIVTFIMWNHT